MYGNERKNLTLNSRHIKLIMSIRIIIGILPVLWVASFFIFKLISFGTPSFHLTTLIIVVSLVLILLLIDSIFTRKFCRCPFCGSKWSLIKYKRFRRNKFDLINSPFHYVCYNCKSEVEII